MPTSGLLDAGSDPRQLCATMELAAHLAQGQRLRLLPCAEAAMLCAQPQIAELLLGHRQPRSGVPRGKESGSSRGASAKITLNFLPKLIPSLIRLGSNLVKKIEPHVGGRWVSLVDGLLVGWLVG